jgi:hypothetical protein
MTLSAPIRWAQRKDKVLVTVGVIDVRDPVLNIEGTNFTFTGSAGQSSYSNTVELYADVDHAQSKYVVRPRGVEIALVKKDASVWWPRLIKGTAKAHWLSVDWNRWVDSSEDEPAKPDFNWNPGEGAGIGHHCSSCSSDDDEAAASDPAADALEPDPPAADGPVADAPADATQSE